MSTNRKLGSLRLDWYQIANARFQRWQALEECIGLLSTTERYSLMRSKNDLDTAIAGSSFSIVRSVRPKIRGAGVGCSVADNM
jgi:hypothetical protein